MELKGALSLTLTATITVAMKVSPPREHIFDLIFCVFQVGFSLPCPKI